MAKLTEQQLDIIQQGGDQKINAVAGSGKTTTVIAYAKRLPKGARVLYLAFNRSVRQDAKLKFAKANIPHVKVETAHSLAFSYVVRGSAYRLKQGDYAGHELVKMLRLSSTGDPLSEYIIANHVLRFAAYFCNSAALKIRELDYRLIVQDRDSLAFVQEHYDMIEQKTREFLALMNAGKIEITHDFYLKKFQLQAPQLPYEYILFDEGQDASPAMLDVFLKQSAIKLIVGDTHQQIYRWRHAVNSLEQVKFEKKQLSISFRFGPSIAALASEVISWKSHIKGIAPRFQMQGVAKPADIKTKAVIARTNLGLLLKAIEYVTESKQLSKIHFEGNIHSYTYADDGSSLFDVLNLHNRRRDLIRSPLIKQMKNEEELEDYIKKTEDVQLKMMLEIVNEYGNEIPVILKQLKDKHVDAAEKEEADVIFSTVHRAKGMEYDMVSLVDDFITEDKVKRLSMDHSDNELMLAGINEEINLLYVAITRAKHRLYVPDELLPADFPRGGAVIPLQPKKEEELTTPSSHEKKKGSYQPWLPADDRRLEYLFQRGVAMQDLADELGRTKGAIYSRLKKLDLVKSKEASQ
ncbi:MAG: UvrD-helicase domain-containing protein [Cyclobacteriaceae bacterium]|nr:ATP-dependent helicase [Cyclobacteriaceae bacterium]MCH8516377.1 UvrD-helicase domain-containing protein [Cyclobacteriaceae bacterium]